MWHEMFEYQNITDYWSNHGFERGVHFQEKPFFDRLVKACSGGRKKVLDIGVGDGRMPRNIQQFCQADFFGIDLTDQIRNAPVTQVRGDTRLLPFSENIFDVVYSLGVIEHFQETSVALAEHVRVLKRGGMLFLTTPHLSIATFYKYYQFYRSGLYRYNTFEAVRGRNLTLGEIRKILSRFPLEIIELRGSGVRPSENIYKNMVKRLIPSCCQHPHLYCIAEKV